MSAAILGTGCILPGQPRTTSDVAALVGRPDAGEKYAKKTGIQSRHWVEEGTRLAPLAAEAIRLALARAGTTASELRRLILVKSGGGDLMFPATANRVAAALGLSGSCDCFDLNNACMGFLTGFDLAARCVATGLGPVAVVAAELTSRGIRPAEPRPFLVFGDAVAAAVVGPARRGEGIVASHFGNDGTLPNDVFAEEPALTGKREYIQFAKSNSEIFEIAFRAMAGAISSVLERAEMTMADIAWVLPHQPNGAMVDEMVERLAIDPAKVVRVVHEIGSVASASIPVSLDRLMRTRAVRPGDRILLVGVGGGVAYGALIYQVGGAE
jgi:3-oxoacyl-[acyl-carrier-protein] synthase-3